jgi:hypothetical protein
LAIDAEGKVSNAELISGSPLLGKYAVANAQLWTFAKPDHPPHLHTITYEFEIENRMATSVSFDLPDRVKIVTSFAEIEGQ